MNTYCVDHFINAELGKKEECAMCALAARLAEVEATSLARDESLHATYARLAEAERLLRGVVSSVRYRRQIDANEITTFLGAADSASADSCDWCGDHPDGEGEGQPCPVCGKGATSTAPAAHVDEEGAE